MSAFLTRHQIYEGVLYISGVILSGFQLPSFFVYLSFCLTLIFSCFFSVRTHLSTCHAQTIKLLLLYFFSCSFYFILNLVLYFEVCSVLKSLVIEKCCVYGALECLFVSSARRQINCTFMNQNSTLRT